MGREALEGLRVSPKAAASRKINKRITSHPVIAFSHLVVNFLNIRDLSKDIAAATISLTDDRHVCVLHKGEVAGRDGDLAQVGPREVDLHVLDHHAGLVGRSDLQEMRHI